MELIAEIQAVNEVVNMGWGPGIGDPTPAGWFTVAAYFVAAIMCAIQSRRSRDQSRGRPRVQVSDRAFWLGLAVVLGLLGINKQLDLQTALTEFARQVARTQGWYENRRIVQQYFIGGVVVSGVLGFLIMTTYNRSLVNRHALTCLGLLVLVFFVVIRAASFHHVDLLLRNDQFGVSLNPILELSGIGLVALGALIGLLGHSGASGKSRSKV